MRFVRNVRVSRGHGNGAAEKLPRKLSDGGRTDGASRIRLGNFNFRTRTTGTAAKRTFNPFSFHNARETEKQRTAGGEGYT